MNTMNKKELLYDALAKHYLAERAEAEATLHVYFNDSVGFGEHPQIVEEMKKQVDKMANAEDCLEILKRNFN